MRILRLFPEKKTKKISKTYISLHYVHYSEGGSRSVFVLLDSYLIFNVWFDFGCQIFPKIRHFGFIVRQPFLANQPSTFLKASWRQNPKKVPIFKRDARAEKKTLLLVNTFQKRLERNFFQQVVCDAENYVKDSQAVSAELQNFKMVNLYKVEKSRKNHSPLKKKLPAYANANELSHSCHFSHDYYSKRIQIPSIFNGEIFSGDGVLQALL